MTEIQRYLAEEVAEDLADGIIPGGKRSAAWACSV